MKLERHGNIAKTTFTAFAPLPSESHINSTPKTVVRMGYGRSYDIGVFGSNFGHTVTAAGILPVLVKGARMWTPAIPSLPALFRR